MHDFFRRLVERGWLRWLWMALDIVLINVAFFFAWWTRYQLELGGDVEFVSYRTFEDYLPTSLGLTLLMMLNLQLEGAYRMRRGTTWVDEVSAILHANANTILLIVFFYFFTRPFAYSRLILFYVAAFVFVFLAAARLVQRWWMGRLRRQGIGVTRALVVGADETGRTLMRHIVAQPDLGYQIVGFVDDNPARQHDIGRFQALGGTDTIRRLVRDHQVDKVILTLPWQEQQKIKEIMEECEQAGVESMIVPDLFQLSLTRVSLDEIRGVPLIGIHEPVLTGANLALKRVIDIAVSGLVLVLFSPLWLLLALLIKIESPGPVLFQQTRVGRNGHNFTIYKFRSMRQDAEQEREKLSHQNEADGPLFKIRNDPRVTRMGRFLRKTSLDEIPQLWNVLKGDMSLIGPRPALPTEVAQYQDWHHKRLEVAPGLTGLWQVSGRSDVTFDEMMLLDIYYAERWSPMLDTMILLKTIPTVLLQRGAY
jgi:exopolysaccharide biosynthesis polyprenyl glycosylphosphotransferase